MSGKAGEFLVDTDGRSFWSTSGSGASKAAADQINSSSQPAASGWKVEKYTGELSRDDDLVKKPVAAMSFGQRVRIARIFQSYEEFLDKEIKVAGWVKNCRAQKECCFVKVNDGSCNSDIQVVISQTAKDFAEISKAIVGASVQFKGTLIKSPA